MRVTGVASPVMADTVMSGISLANHAVASAGIVSASSVGYTATCCSVFYVDFASHLAVVTTNSTGSATTYWSDTVD